MALPVSTQYKAALAKARQRRAKIVQFTKKDDSTATFTDHDRQIVYGGKTFVPAYNSSDVVSVDDLSNDNLQYHGVLRTPQITEESMRVGDWDGAHYVILELFWDDHSKGVRFIRAGTLGEISTGRLDYSAELDGMAKQYATVIGQLLQPGCRHDLYSQTVGNVPGCTVDPAAFTETGTLTGAADDLITLYDTGRTEPGPTGGVDVLNITQANPGVVTLVADPSPAFTDNELVTIAGVGGMVEVNAQTVVHDPSGPTFNLSVDTSSFGAYTSGGTVTPVGGGADVGTWTYGVITFTGGANDGYSMEVSDYVPGQLTLALPMPYPCQAGDPYSIRRGCDKTLPTCRDIFDNTVNFDGEHWLTGNDALLTVGQQL